MNNTWFISDTHFGHKNILEYERDARQFDTVEDMNEAIIERWNLVVRDNDTIYHLGDFCFGKLNISIADRLKGKKRLILGNHDVYPSRDYLQYFDQLYGIIFWKKCVLSHMPIHMREHNSRWLLNVHGHLHSKNIKTDYLPIVKVNNGEVVIEKRNDPNYFNVSCEQNNLTPIHADIIFERLKEVGQ